MKTIKQQLTKIKAEKKIGLMTHVVIGFPNVKDSIQIVLEMEKAGADFVELQIPFSDPLADGPTIMRANDIALQHGVTIQECFEVVDMLSKQVDIPLLFMAYYQSIFHLGVSEFCKRASAVGAQGLIVPDIPVDEEPYEHFIAACEKYHMHHIRVLSPSCTVERIKLNAAVQNGFVYCTSRSGTTGVSSRFDLEMTSYLETIKKHITVPIALGFGISKPEQIRSLVGKVDIVVVGSSLIDHIETEGVGNVGEMIEKFVMKK